jgi:hypothetical protein
MALANVFSKPKSWVTSKMLYLRVCLWNIILVGNKKAIQCNFQIIPSDTPEAKIWWYHTGLPSFRWNSFHFLPARIFSAWNREASSSLLLPPDVTCVRRCERPSPRSQSVVRVAKEGRPCECAAHSAPTLSSLIPRSSEVVTKEKFFVTMTKPHPEHILPMCELSLGLGFRVYARPKTLNPKPLPEIAKFRRE